jgi:hypothetical protein
MTKRDHHLPFVINKRSNSRSQVTERGRRRLLLPRRREQWSNEGNRRHRCDCMIRASNLRAPFPRRASHRGRRARLWSKAMARSLGGKDQQNKTKSEAGGAAQAEADATTQQTPETPAVLSDCSSTSVLAQPFASTQPPTPFASATARRATNPVGPRRSEGASRQTNMAEQTPHGTPAQGEAAQYAHLQQLTHANNAHAVSFNLSGTRKARARAERTAFCVACCIDIYRAHCCWAVCVCFGL